MASPGWAQLGSALAGGGVLPAQLAEAQGESLGANTQNAIAEAQLRYQKQKGREDFATVAPDLAAASTDPVKLGNVLAAAARGEIPAEMLAQTVAQNQRNSSYNTIINPETPDEIVARHLAAQGKESGLLRETGQGQTQNILHPEQGVTTTPLGDALAAMHSAQTQNQLSEANLHTQQATHPEKFRILPPQPGAEPGVADGSQPHQNDATLKLIASGDLPAPAPGSRGWLMLGGDEAMQRVNYLAQHPEAAAAPGGGPAPEGFHGQTYKTSERFTNDAAGNRTDEAINRVAGHINTVKDIAAALGNSDVRVANAARARFQTEFGYALPGQADLAAQVLGTEIIKSMTNQGVGTGPERQALEGKFSSATTPAQIAGNLQTAIDLVKKQARARNQHATASGVKDYYGKHLTPETRALLQLGDQEPKAAPAVGPATFASEAEAEAAAAAGKIKSGDKITVGGQTGTWQ